MKKFLWAAVVALLLAGCAGDDLTVHRYGQLQSARAPSFLADGQVAHYVCEGCGGIFDENKDPLDTAVLPRLSGELTLWINDTSFPLESNGMSAFSAAWYTQGLSVNAGDRLTVRAADDPRVIYSCVSSGNLDSRGEIIASRVQVTVKLQASVQGLTLTVEEGKYPGTVALVGGREFPLEQTQAGFSGLLPRLEAGSRILVEDNLTGARYGYEALNRSLWGCREGENGAVLLDIPGDYRITLTPEGQLELARVFEPGSGKGCALVADGIRKPMEGNSGLQYLSQGTRLWLRETDTGRIIGWEHLAEALGGDFIALEDSELTITQNGTYSIRYDPETDTFTLEQICRGTLKEAAFAFDKRIAASPSGLEQYRAGELQALYEEYLALSEHIKPLLRLEEKLETMYRIARELEDSAEPILYLNTPETDHVYLSRQALFEGFYTDFYYYICLWYGDAGLREWGVKSLEDFLALAQDYYGAGMKNLYGIGFAAGEYFLESRRNYPLECQTEAGFFGFCRQNGMYEEILPFLVRFFAYWRIDEGYANRSNPGADIFAESWAPTVDIAKFFYYDAFDSYVQTERVLDCFTAAAGVAYLSGDPLPTPALRGYRFAGWYDSPDFTGEPVTALPAGEGVRLYAKWLADEDQRDRDAAALVDIMIYNLTTGAATRNEHTVAYAKAAYDALPETAKALVEEKEALLDLAKRYE